MKCVPLSMGTDAELWQMQQLPDLREEFYVVCQAKKRLCFARGQWKAVLKEENRFKIPYLGARQL